MKEEVNFSELYLNLLETEQNNSAKMETTPPTLCTNSSECQNSSCSLVVSNENELFSTQDREFISIIADLENLDSNSEANAEVTKTGRIEKEVNFSELYLNLFEIEQTNSSKMETTPPTSVPTLQSVIIHLVNWLSLTKLRFFLLWIENLFPF